MVPLGGNGRPPEPNPSGRRTKAEIIERIVAQTEGRGEEGDEAAGSLGSAAPEVGRLRRALLARTPLPCLWSSCPTNGGLYYR